MKITTNPDDPEFRKALRELGAPDSFPQNAPRHVADGTCEPNHDGTWTVRYVCSHCGWEKHFHISDKGRQKETINQGDPWAHHSGTTMSGFQITGLKPISDSDDILGLFEDFLNTLD